MRLKAHQDAFWVHLEKKLIESIFFLRADKNEKIVETWVNRTTQRKRDVCCGGEGDVVIKSCLRVARSNDYRAE